jgi:hypothetical protein
MTYLIKSTVNEYLTTIEQEKQDKNIDKCLEYTEYQDSFKALLKELTIEIKPIGNAIDYEEYKDWSANEYMNQERIVYLVKIKRNNKQISFKFCDSYYNALEHKRPDLYSILASIGSEYDLNDTSFEDFCNEFGYNTDSKRAEKIYKNWVAHNDKLNKIFNPEDIEVLPH